jgi:DNA-binding transcriptional MerR regulator
MSEAARLLPIGAVAERAGMSASRIRYYEARGLLPEPERAAGKRRYPNTAPLRLLGEPKASGCGPLDFNRG